MDTASGAARATGRLAWVAGGVAGQCGADHHAGLHPELHLCFMLAVRGLRGSEGKPAAACGAVIDFVTGFLIAAPAFWLFTKLLGINLPGLTGTAGSDPGL
jgi:putative tricarboxylic transport membrane protein